MIMLYLGNDEYELYLGTKVITLSTSDIENIAEYAINNDFNVPTTNSLHKKVETLEDEVKDLKEQVSDWKFEFQRIIDDMKEVLDNE